MVDTPVFSDHSDLKCFEILYRKKSTKKHKIWEGDALAVPKSNAFLIKVNQKTIASVPAEKIEAGAFFAHGSYEFEVGGSTSASKLARDSSPVEPATQFTPEPKKSVVKSPSSRPMSSGTSAGGSERSLADLLAGKTAKPAPLLLRPTSAAKHTVEGESESSNKLKRPLDGVDKPQISKLTLSRSMGASSKPVNTAAKPGFSFPVTHSKAVPQPEGKWQIDPVFTTILRPHQTQAVEFLYDCISGKRHCYGKGALLADDMGLGKTLTSIALVHSLLQCKLIETALIACPATLVKNWRDEFRKWLPTNTHSLFVFSPGEDIKVFCKPGLRRTYPIMIAGYERIRTVASEIKDEMGEFDLVICDEGHRIKNGDSKTLSSLEEISGEKRIILTGTPIQNNLGEFWTMAHFLNPGVLGNKISRFTRQFSDPIRASRGTDASLMTRELGEEKMRELIEITNEFVLRRDQSVLAGHLTVPKTEYLVFCKPLEEQVEAYQTELADTQFWPEVGSSSGGGQALQLLTKLRKISTSTQLLKKSGKSGFSSLKEELAAKRPLAGSNKFRVLKSLLTWIYKNTDDKVVIVSGSTETLDFVQLVCAMCNMRWVRLDGSTPQNERQSTVNWFNNKTREHACAFLLSAKSGGVGLNLIGGSRLVMLDCDWNPSVDLQAMARVHRDGQKKPVFIYRLLSTGMVDEKILQRQITKQGVSNSLFEQEDAGDNFTCDQLREVFAYKTCVKSDTLEQGIALDYAEPAEIEPALDATCKETGLITCILQRTKSDISKASDDPASTAQLT